MRFFLTTAEFAEIAEFFNQELFTPRPPRLRGAISESCFTGMPEVPLFFYIFNAVTSFTPANKHFRLTHV
jgi:hypothetical protein